MKKNILIIGGLGDFIAAESWMTDEECAAVENIYWCTANRKYIQEVIRFEELFPNLKEQIVLYDDWGTVEDEKSGNKLFAINNKEELITKLNLDLDPEWIENELTDLGPPQICKEIIARQRYYYMSRISKMTYEMPKNVELPEKFMLIHPWSDTLRTPDRDFDDTDWQGVIGFLETNDIQGVVVNQSIDIPPEHPRLIDLSNQLTLPEVFAIAQKATYFAGAASFLHVLMIKLISERYVYVKGKFFWLQDPTHVNFLFYNGPVVSHHFRICNDLKWIENLKP